MKGSLLQEKKKMKIVQHRRDNRFGKKFSKSKKSTVEKERKQKQLSVDSAIEKWKKGKNSH